MQDKIYKGVASRSGDNCITVVENDVEIPLRHHVKHSPDGFSWGYAGSGPAETARCILLDFYGVDDDVHLPVSYQQFKFDVIANISTDSDFNISSTLIREWASDQKSVS